MSALMNQARNRVPRLAEAAVERARLTVVPRVRTRAPRVPFVALVSLLLVTGIAGLLLFNTSMQQASFTAAALEQRADALQAREQSLRMELETLRDPQRVAVQARRMGMVPPSSPAFLRLSDGKVLGQPAPATAEDAVRVIPLPAPKPANLRPEPLVLPRPKPERNSHDNDGAANDAHGRGSDTKKHQQARGQGE
jgi:cell division protein FtsB